MNLKILLFFFLSFLLTCSKQQTTQTKQNQISNKVFSTEITSLNFEVFYEANSEPYTGSLIPLGPETWEITKESYQEIFSNHPRTISVPTTLGDMTSFNDQNKSSWSAQDLVDLGQSIATPLIQGTVATIPIIFISGFFNGNSNVLGVQISGSPYAFIFKDVVTSVGGDSTTQKYVEQSTVVHEIGHLIGLVNNGIPPKSQHEDQNHQKHTINDDCVMYWAVEGASDILSVVSGFVSSNQLNLFQNESLNDAHSFFPN